MRPELEDVVNLSLHPLDEVAYVRSCRRALVADGALVLAGFLHDGVAARLVAEAESLAHLAYFSEQTHNVYLDPPDRALPASNARSRSVVSTKGALTDDLVPDSSALQSLYHSPIFRSFLCGVLDEQALFSYADPLSSINVNFYEPGQELGWHFDNSTFSVTLLLREAEAAGNFEFHAGMRDADAGFHNEKGVAAALDGDHGVAATTVAQAPGDLVLFRGRDALHRVVPVQGATTRIQVVFAYNTEPGCSLSENARRTFFGRLD